MIYHRKRYLTWIYIILIWAMGCMCLPPSMGGTGCSGKPLPISAVDFSEIDTDTPVYLEIGPSTDTPDPFKNKPYFTVAGNTFCRAGFTKEYHEVEVLLPGSTYPVEGQNEDGSWLLLATGEHLCWVSVVTGSMAGSLDKTDFVAAPTRTPIYIPPAAEPVQKQGCGRYKDEMSCMDHFSDGCNWIFPAADDPYCAGP